MFFEDYGAFSHPHGKIKCFHKS